MNKFYIDQCFCLTNKRIIKSLERIKKIGDNTDFERNDIRYVCDEVNDDFVIVKVGEYEQRILVDAFKTTYGERNYFRCNECNARCYKLYLLPKGHTFLCKSCHNLKYETFNPSSTQGKLFLRTKKILKLIKVQEDMTPRIWYKSRYTKRYLKFLKDCLKVGLTNIVDEARSLEEIINTNNSKIEQTL